MKKLQLPPPIRVRRKIPFFYDKSEQEFKQDKYENYAEVVARQIRLHLSKDSWKVYPFQSILDWILKEIGESKSETIIDIGCSVGRLISELANYFPTAECYGIDYSYQLLRQANDYWVDGKTIELTNENRGFKKEKIIGQQSKNLHFILAKGECLPFENESLDLVVSSFTLDRFDEPKKALAEVFRILKKKGKVLIVSPLNFQKKEHWAQFFTIENLVKEIKEIGFSIEKVEENLLVKEPLDLYGNAIHWKCKGLILSKDS
jgi:ubiquinone/menaquinone biosynthesis C-methylase UbiE